MAEPARQRLRNREIARGSVGIDVHRRAAGDPLHRLEPDLADRERLVDEIELMPGWPTLDIKVGAEAQGMNGVVDQVLDGAQACKIDDRNYLFGDIRKALAFAREHFRRPLNLVCKGVSEEV